MAHTSVGLAQRCHLAETGCVGKELGNHLGQNLVAYIALFVALGGGGAWAASSIAGSDGLDNFATVEYGGAGNCSEYKVTVHGAVTQRGRGRIGCMAASARMSAPPRRRRVGTLLALLMIAAGACEDGSRVRSSEPGAVTKVRDAAQRTLVTGPAAIAIRVSSATASYSLRGAIDLETGTFRVRARVTRAPATHFPNDLRVIGRDGETYQVVDRNLSLQDVGRAGCAFDPHAPVGSLGGAASVQETLALVGIATRLLRDAPRAATAVEDATQYRVTFDPRAVSAPALRRSDEWIVVNPPRLARHLAPMLVTVDRGGRVHRLSLELLRFRPPSFGPPHARERRRERVSISVVLSGLGRELDVKRPSCLVME